MYITIIRKLVTISDEVFFKIRVSFDGMVNIKKVFLESNHWIEAHIYVVVEVLEFQSSINFELCLDEEFIAFW